MAGRCAPAATRGCRRRAAAGHPRRGRGRGRPTAATPADADDDAIIIVAPVARGDTILVSFSTSRALTPSIEQAIESGLPTTFTYDVELRRPSFSGSTSSSPRRASPRLSASIR